MEEGGRAYRSEAGYAVAKHETRRNVCRSAEGTRWTARLHKVQRPNLMKPRKAHTTIITRWCPVQRTTQCEMVVLCSSPGLTSVSEILALGVSDSAGLQQKRSADHTRG